MFCFVFFHHVYLAYSNLYQLFPEDNYDNSVHEETNRIPKTDFQSSLFSVEEDYSSLLKNKLHIFNDSSDSNNHMSNKYLEVVAPKQHPDTLVEQESYSYINYQPKLTEIPDKQLVDLTRTEKEYIFLKDKGANIKKSYSKCLYTVSKFCCSESPFYCYQGIFCDKVYINYHSCTISKRKTLYHKNIQSGLELQKYFPKRFCFQVMFDIQFLRKLSEKFDLSDNFERFQYGIFGYLKSKLVNFEKILDDYNIHLLIQFAIGQLQRDKIRIALFFIILVFKLIGSSEKQNFMMECEIRLNLFRKIYFKNINLIASIYRTLSYYQFLKIDTTNFESTIFFIFDSLFREFFLFDFDNAKHYGILHAFQVHILNGLVLLE
ncbi:hypothetical protein H312_03485 [Anncaliia algerae PRA339]|uniref:Rab-GAP TBC domain-containing protein n=1 Tax=Anncaliia algerae PRA339 TaxID=1288291 RepID=A0A059EW97_9MICR|nr:hypothetical protein H312_03485 [Anncaliia algerae PRA339]